MRKYNPPSIQPISTKSQIIPTHPPAHLLILNVRTIGFIIKKVNIINMLLPINNANPPFLASEDVALFICSSSFSFISALDSAPVNKYTINLLIININQTKKCLLSCLMDREALPGIRFIAIDPESREVN